MQEHDDGRWVKLVSDVCGLAELGLCNFTHSRDSLLFSTLIYISRWDIHSYELELVKALTQIDSSHTLWSKLVREARNRGCHSIHDLILREIRRLYNALHRDTDAAPTPFSAST